MCLLGIFEGCWLHARAYQHVPTQNLLPPHLIYKNEQALPLFWYLFQVENLTAYSLNLLSCRQDNSRIFRICLGEKIEHKVRIWGNLKRRLRWNICFHSQHTGTELELNIVDLLGIRTNYLHAKQKQSEGEFDTMILLAVYRALRL